LPFSWGRNAGLGIGLYIRYNNLRFSSFAPIVREATMPTRLPMEVVDREMARILAEKTEVERLQIGWGMQRSARRMMTRIIRAEHSDWTEEEVNREVARRFSHGG
jgi:hypothetical protein